MFVPFKLFNKLQKEVEILKKDITILKQGHQLLVQNDVALKQDIDKKKEKQPQYFG